MPISRNAFRYRLVDAVRRQFAQADERRLILELEGPGHRPFDRPPGARRELRRAGQRLGDIGAIDRPVTIDVFRMHGGRAGCTALRIGFAQNHRTAASSGNSSMIGEPAFDIAELFGETHAHAPVHQFRLALGVEGDEIELRPHLRRSPNCGRGCSDAGSGAGTAAARGLSGLQVCGPPTRRPGRAAFNAATVVS